MSFVDLATLTLHRRHEMEDRISTFTGKCDQAINNIRKLKTQSRTFVDKLNCEPSELKERFLSCMNKLDEFIYLMTEFNLSIDNLDKKGSMELAPVHDNSYKNYPVMTPSNLMDVLSEPAPTVSSACPNLCPAEKPHTKRRPKAEQLLITFSSTSCSAESVPETNARVEKEVQCVAEDIEDLTIKDPETMVALPAQETLETDKEYEATIMSVDGATFWVAINDADDAYKDLFLEMAEYYEQEENRVEFPSENISDFTYLVYQDVEDTGGFYRAVFMNEIEGSKEAQVFLVDTGEFRPALGGLGCLQPMAPRFAARPPYARCAHLADVDFLGSKAKEVEAYLKQFVGNKYVMKVDDNSSESLGVYLFFDDGTSLNELLVEEELATALDRQGPGEAPPGPSRGPPELVLADSAERLEMELNLAGPEYENPVEAVTGYSSRDEMDICKHYKGGADKTCFKGARCKKRHVLMHPDGWTRDRVAVAGKCRSLPLPAPGTWHKVVVTYVCHFDRLYVHFDQDKVKDELPRFGVVLPPASLASLVRDMNSPATYAAFKPLQMAPAPGELVAAKYCDGLWYRARVLCSTRADQCVELIYIDYGNVVSVKENEIMELDARFMVLPAQAVLCRLAGVAKLGDCSRQWAAAKARLAGLAQDQSVEAQVIARGYDEITVEMFDAEGSNLAELLAAGGDVAYHQDYAVEDDSRRRFHHVLP